MASMRAKKAFPSLQQELKSLTFNPYLLFRMSKRICRKFCPVVDGGDVYCLVEGGVCCLVLKEDVCLSWLFVLGCSATVGLKYF